LDTFNPAVPCAGAELLGLRVSVEPGPIITGVIVDPADPSTPLDPTSFGLVWPPSYAIAFGAAGTEVIDANGSFIASDGTVLVRPQVCRENDRLLVIFPGETPIRRLTPEIRGSGAQPPIDAVGIAPFLEAAAGRPEFVGAGLVDDGRRLVVTVHESRDAMVALARSMLPPGAVYEIRVVAYGLAELNALKDRIVAEQLAGPAPNISVIFVDVDELRGLVVIGVDRLDGDVSQALTGRYGPLVVVEGST